MSNKDRDRAAIKTFGGVVAILTGLAIAGEVSQQNSSLDPDTQAWGMLFYGVLTVPVAILIFYVVMDTIWQVLDDDQRERTTLAQILASLAAIFLLCPALVGLFAVVFKPTPPALRTVRTYPIMSAAVTKINSVAYPKMKILSAGPYSVQAVTLDGYATVVAYYNGHTGQTGTTCATTDLGCTEWTSASTDGTPITFSAAQCAATAASAVDEDPTTAPATPVSPYTILTYQLKR